MAKLFKQAGEIVVGTDSVITPLSLRTIVELRLAGYEQFRYRVEYAGSTEVEHTFGWFQSHEAFERVMRTWKLESRDSFIEETKEEQEVINA